MKKVLKNIFNVLKNIVIGFLSFVIPAVGTALWLFYRKTNKKLAAVYLVLAIAGFAANYSGITFLEKYTGVKVEELNRVNQGGN